MDADRLKAAGILAILALPLPMIAAVFGLALEDPNRWLGYTGAGAGVAAIAVILVAVVIRPAPGQKPDPVGMERYGTLLAVGFALGAASTAFLLAVANVLLAVALLVVAAAWTLIWLPSQMRTFVVEISVDIDRDPATVFAYVSDFRNLVQWFPSYISVEKTTPGPIGVGTRFHERVQLSSGMVEGDDDFTEFEPGRRLASHTPGSRNVAVDTFEPIGTGTRVTHRFQGIVGYGLALMGGARKRSQGEATILAVDRPAFARLKQVLESSVQPST